MSDTPRTDATLKWVNDGLGHKFAYVSDFAALCSELELENAALRNALTFYADWQTYGLNGGNIKIILMDAGAIARHAMRKEAKP